MSAWIFILTLQLFQWWFNHNTIPNVYCTCTFELMLSADTTVSSDFLQVYYKSLESTFDCYFHNGLLSLSSWRPLRASAAGSVCLPVVHWSGWVKLGSRVRGQPQPWCKTGLIDIKPTTSGSHKSTWHLGLLKFFKCYLLPNPKLTELHLQAFVPIH